MQKIENYNSALSQLKQAIAVYTAKPDDALYRDGLIQRFEFTFELAWKSLKEYMEGQGLIPCIASPRSILKEAFAMSIINDSETWNHILSARNLTSHIYDEKTAEDIASKVCREFLTVFQALADFYQSLV